MKKNLWIVSELYFPEETSTGYFLTRIAEGLSGRFNVGVLCGQPTYSSRGRSAPSREFRHGVRIHRCWSTTLNKDILFFRVVNSATLTLSVLFNGLFRFHAADCVMVVTNPPLLPFAVLIASRIRRCNCCLIIHDVYPEVLTAAGFARENSAIVRIMGWSMRQLYKRMAGMIVLGRDMEALIRRKLASPLKPLHIIPNWADTEFIKPRRREGHPFLNRLGLTDKFIIQYSGNIGRTHGIEQLVACAEQLKDTPAIHFLFIGFGGKKDGLTQSARERSLSNITILDYLPRGELPLSLTACDMAVISLISGMGGVSVPSRLYNVMAAGKPVLAVADPESELAAVVREEEIGWVVSPADTEGCRLAVLDAMRNPGNLAQMGRRARRAAESTYSFERAIRAYAAVVNSVYGQEGFQDG